MMDLPRRGRPPKKQAQSYVSAPVPPVEDFHSGSSDEKIEIGNFQQEDKILVGNKSKADIQKRIFHWPFGPKKLDKEAILAEYLTRVKSYLEKTDEVFSNPNSINQYNSYPGNDILQDVLIIANDNKSACDQIHADLCQKLIKLADVIPLDMENFNNAVEIGEYWKQVTAKVHLISTSWAPLCQKERNLQDFESIFKGHLSQIFEESYPDLFTKLSEIIVNAYSEARESNDISGIVHSFGFISHSQHKLFKKIFMKILIKSVIQYYEPILNELFSNHPLSEYLQKSVEIKEKEKNLIKTLISRNALKKLEKKFNLLIFGNEERFNSICNNLAPLIKQKDSESIRICADFARSTDKITPFARELSFEFESEAEKCFKMENPIKAIMKLHLSLIEFDKSFNPTHARILRSAFEKGFNISPDRAALLLAQEVNREFTKKENNHKMCPKETIDQLVAVFRMIASKDVFESAHHHYLTRRILMMKSHIIEADKYFKRALKEQCGPDYTKRLNDLFKDLNVSLATLDKFVKEKRPPPFFKAIVISNESWKLYETGNPIDPPDEIKVLLNSFTNFYSTENEKKKLQWDFNFTRVKLTTKNLGLIKTINCSGTYATFLLMFNQNHVLCPEHLKKLSNFSNEQIENIVKVLKSKKCNHFLLVMHNKIRINKDQFASEEPDSKDDNKYVQCSCFDYKKGVLSIPFVFPSVPKTDNDKQKSAIQSNRENQINAAVMKVMKQERSMEKSALKNTVKDLLNFRLEDELFDERLAHLSKTLYLKLDPSGRVHYLT